ncbi:MAG: hypothetical protein K5694_00505, partial [Bacilli bacterium]|nr:hypothetical protein [Bacilli bacterium]
MNRKETPIMKNAWDLTALYKKEEDFESDLKTLKETIIPEMASYEGKLSNEEDFVKYLLLEKKMNKVLTKLYLYASCSSDLNKKDIERTKRLSRVQQSLYELIAATSFESPEILSLGEEKVKEFLSRHEEIADFDYSFEKLFLDESHVLSDKEEALLSTHSPLLSEG